MEDPRRAMLKTLPTPSKQKRDTLAANLPKVQKIVGGKANVAKVFEVAGVYNIDHHSSISFDTLDGLHNFIVYAAQHPPTAAESPLERSVYTSLLADLRTAAEVEQVEKEKREAVKKVC